LAQEADRKRQELLKSRGGSVRKADLGDPLKWGLVDAKHFGEILKQYDSDLSELKELRAGLKRKVRQIESKMLKGKQNILNIVLNGPLIPCSWNQEGRDCTFHKSTE
jgi:hypothetical protein